MIAEKYLLRHFASTQRGLAESDLDNAFWLPGAERPADGLTEVRSDVVPLLRLHGIRALFTGALATAYGSGWNSSCVRTFRYQWAGDYGGIAWQGCKVAPANFC